MRAGMLRIRKREAELLVLTAEEKSFARQFIEGAPWKFAETMPETPLEYTLPRWHRNPADFVRMAALIHRVGTPAQFKHLTYCYLRLDGWKYWTNEPVVADVTRIDRARV